MRASVLTLIFIVTEYTIITGGDGNCPEPPNVTNAKLPKDYHHNVTKFRMECKHGYVRQAGSSNLFKCKEKKWINNLPLNCTLDPRLRNTTTHAVTTQPTTTSIVGKVATTSSHKSSATTWTFRQTSQRTTTVEETSVNATPTRPRITASSMTEKEHLTTVSSHSPTTTSHSNTSTGSREKLTSTQKAGIITSIFVIVAVSAAAVAFLYWRPCSRLRRGGGHSEMQIRNPGSDQPLMNPHSIMNSCPPASTQPQVTPLTDSPRNTHTDAPLSA